MDITEINESGAFQGKNVLVAEDNPANQLVLKKLLKKVNLAPVFANDGQIVLDKYKESPDHWHLVLMDCEMPVMDGYTATAEIRAHEEQASLDKITIIGLSAHAIDDLKNKALDKGMDDYLTKPIDRELLYKTLFDYLS
jgi:CheY-like chemotaxis protein